MRPSLTRPLTTCLACATGLGLFAGLSDLTPAQSAPLLSFLASQASDPTDDDRGSGRLATESILQPPWSWRGSGRIDPNSDASAKAPLIQIDIAYRGSGRVGNETDIA
ncbi:MAG: hypothetical protein ACFCVD_00095 [Nodosilinea sp.]